MTMKHTKFILKSVSMSMLKTMNPVKEGDAFIYASISCVILNENRYSSIFYLFLSLFLTEYMRFTLYVSIIYR